MTNMEKSVRDVPVAKQVIERVPGQTAPDMKHLNISTFIEIVNKWPNYQTWPFRVGVPLIASSIAFTAIYINNHFRKTLFLQHYARLSSYFPIVIVPTVTGALMYLHLVSGDIIEQRTKCPICVQAKAAAVQIGFGCFYPLLLAPLINFPIAGALPGSYIPKVSRNPMEVMKFTREILKPAWGKIRILTLSQIVLAMGVAHFQQDFYFSVLLPIVLGPENSKKSPPPTTTLTTKS